MAGRVLTANFPEAQKVGIRKVYYGQIDEFPKQFRQWANVLMGMDPGGESGRAFFDDLQIAPIGTVAGKPEGDVIQYDSPVEGNLVRYTPYSFALGSRWTHEAKQDLRFGVAEGISRQLANASMHGMEVQAHRTLNNGFGVAGGTGHTATGFDSLALFSTAHTLVRGGTGSNRATTDQDLSVTALENAFDIMNATVDEAGYPAPIMSRDAVLVIPPPLEWVAKEITKSELKPYTANNEVNPLPELQYMVDYYLTDQDSWYLLGPKGKIGINVWIREAPWFEMGDDFDTKDTKFSTFFRMATGHSEWRNTFGSLGA